MKFNLGAAKAAFAQSVEGAQAVAGVKDVQDLLALRTRIAEAQAGYSALAEEAFGVYTRGVASWVDSAAKSAPAGSDVAVNAFKSTMAATTAAFDQFQKASKQVVSIADANVRAAAATAAKAVKTKKAA